MFFQSRSTFLKSLPILLLLFSAAGTQTLKAPKETISISVNEGTELSFDISPDGQMIVFDLLGQLWLIPARGGKAEAITDAVRDVAEDQDPSFSPDGSSILFRGERNGKTGLWLLDLKTNAVRQLTQLSYPDGFDGDASWSPDGRSIAFLHTIPPDPVALRPPRAALFVLDIASGGIREVKASGIEEPKFASPIWSADGSKIAIIVKKAPSDKVGRVWTIPAEGGTAVAITGEASKVRGPLFFPNGKRIAYFSPDQKGQLQIWTREIGIENASALKLTDHDDITTTRLRWNKKTNEIIYSADGRLWKMPSSGGSPKEIPFTASLSINRQRNTLPQARFPEPGRQEPARGFMGLSISPDGQKIGMLALGKLWIIPVGGQPRAIATVPFEATTLAWSPDGSEVAWSAGVVDKEDIFAANLSNGSIRQVTALNGREALPVYSPDGRYLAFVHTQDNKSVLRSVDAKGVPVTDVAKTRDLGAIGPDGTCSPQWSPESDGLLVCGGTRLRDLRRATFVPLNGERQTITRFPNAPIFLQWTPQKNLIFARHDRLWSLSFDGKAVAGDPQPLGSDAALYMSAARDGTLLYVSEGGLRLRRPDGTVTKIGWPVTYTPPVPDPIVIKNVRVIDGTGSGATSPRDILIEKGRIARIDASGKISASSAKLIDGSGRFVIPGLFDLHAHVYRPDLLPGWLYFGITTVRDQGASMGPLTSYAGDIASRALPGPRVAYGGFQYYSDWAFDEEQGRGIEPEADAEHIKRAVDLSEAFGAQHIKTRTFRRWDINARMINEAHRRGMRATGHCSHLLPLIAAGMDAKEHIGLCEARGNAHMYDDMVQLFKAAAIGVVPTVSYLDYAVRLSEKPSALEEDSELGPFMPSKDNFGWMLEMSKEIRDDWAHDVQNTREGLIKLFRAGVTVGVGTDIWQIPTGAHMELEQLVAAGMTPSEAIVAGTRSSARILGADKELGTIEVGKRADLIILDADPLADIRNTRKIWNVIKDGALVDRGSILKLIKPR